MPTKKIVPEPFVLTPLCNFSKEEEEKAEAEVDDKAS